MIETHLDFSKGSTDFEMMTADPIAIANQLGRHGDWQRRVTPAWGLYWMDIKDEPERRQCVDGPIVYAEPHAVGFDSAVGMFTSIYA